MAPSRKAGNPTDPHNVGDLAAPLADYFFICGVESSQIYDEKLAPPSAPVEDTIEENEALITNGDTNRPDTPGLPNDSVKRRSRYSFEARKSIGSIITNGDPITPGSNRSSATIKPSRADNTSGLSDLAFEDALKKFASERETVLEEVHISTPTTTSASLPKKTRPRTMRITQDETSMAPGLRGSVGSLQRRLSTMKSMTRQSSALTHQSSVRTSKRLSGYNSVIPAPQPFQSTPDMHPLKRPYEPVLLDRYPTKAMVEETKRRKPFPDYVPMFCFPNDVTVVSSDERPRSTWHGFAMTGEGNNKTHGMCLTTWVPLNQGAAEGLERQCEEWRRVNMSDEERELASSLGERLSLERAKLSRLLAELPNSSSDSAEREELEEAISAVEEKIGLMTDLLRPVRHGAASKIDGLTEGDTGFWIPRVYGILGRDDGMMSFWKEWLKAVAVPMANGSILRVPPSSPRVGLWQPLERYVVNLCVEALSPITSLTQVEVAVRELRLYARKEAINELPGSRTVDIYALFRCLTIPNIVTLFEYALAESRIIFVSSHTAMLQLACAALVSLLYPLKWAHVYIPVLPQRLIQALEAPCPYIAGVERRHESFDLLTDDFCIVDLDENTIESTAPPTTLPRPQRRKLTALLQAAAPHHNRFGVPIGPPRYALETFPHDAFSSENPQVFSARPAPSTLANYVSESSVTFGSASTIPYPRTSVYNAFLQTRSDAARGNDRPSTSSTGTGNSTSSSHSPPSPETNSPVTPSFPFAPAFKNDSGLALQNSLREKRSGSHLGGENMARRNSAVNSLFNARHPQLDTGNYQQHLEHFSGPRRPSQQGLGHHSSNSTSTLGNGTASNYAPSVYAQSTLAASTMMPHMLFQPVKDDERTKWIEGHCLQRRNKDMRSICTICDDRCEHESFRCSGKSPQSTTTSQPKR